jgi:endoglucanase Acf2
VTARRATIAVAVVLAIAVVVTLVLVDRGPGRDADGTVGAAAPEAPAGGWTAVAGAADPAIAPAALDLPEIPGDPGPMRVDPGLAPPTNRWYSGMLFGDRPQPVFAVPLALLAEEDAITIGLPEVSTTATTVAAPFVAHLRLGLPADDFVATDADPVSVEVTYRRSGRATGTMRSAAGWPFVSYTALEAQTVTLPPDLAGRAGGRWLALEDGSGTYGVAVADAAGSSVTPDVDGPELSLRRGETVLLFAAPESGVAALAAHAVPLTGTEIEYDVDGDTTWTRIHYRTAGGPTVFATMPHHRLKDAGAPPADGSQVESIWGPLHLQVGNALSAAVATLEPATELDLAGLDDQARAELGEQLAADAEALTGGPASPTDTYFGGKAAQRDAHLYRLAAALDHPAAGSIRARVVDDLDAWLTARGCAPADTRCFAYDPRFRGVVGRAPAFGSESFNDHHFHYGYFLTAAALLAESDPGLVSRWAPVVAALVEDVAAPQGGAQMPALRVFDPYAGHSWASGTAPFADGNNQESSSEAVNAWNGLALWARVSGDEQLLQQATWMLSQEAATARAYWVEPTVPEGFEHEVVALNWGGKRDWATWFSAEASAMLGIQLLPMGPVSHHLRGDPARIRANVAEAAPDGFATLFGDYLVMYLALADPQAALEAARALPAETDDGLTRSYLLAWLHAQAA